MGLPNNLLICLYKSLNVQYVTLLYCVTLSLAREFCKWKVLHFRKVNTCAFILLDDHLRFLSCGCILLFQSAKFLWRICAGTNGMTAWLLNYLLTQYYNKYSLQSHADLFGGLGQHFLLGPLSPPSSITVKQSNFIPFYRIFGAP
jgi:hypothetical protein